MSNDDRRSRAFAGFCVAVMAACTERGGPEPQTPTDGGRPSDSGTGASRDSRVQDASVEPACAALAVVQSRCATCHAEEPNSDAPMSLVSAQDFQADAVSDDSQRVYEVALSRVRGENAPMPPADAEPLSEDELGLLEGWLEGGAESPETDCEPGSEKRASP